jgi:hypothetical protein
MKRKSILIICLLIVVSIFFYIGISSTVVINKNYYRKLAWELVNHNKTIINWETANVSLKNEKETPMHVAPTLSARINNFLLFLNGGRVISVEFSTTHDDLLGPMVLYFNPFTKQCIGGDLRM